MNKQAINSTSDEKEENNQLKFEGFEIGQVIKAYDHQPRTFINNGKLIERDDYAIGRITDIVKQPTGAKGYKVSVMKDNCFKNQPREEIFVPMEIWGTSEWDGRVSIVYES